MAIAELTRVHGFSRHFDALSAVLGILGPESLKDLRKASFSKFLDLGIPTAKDEEWKYTSLRALEEIDFQPAYGATVSRSELAKTPVGSIDGIVIACVNGQFAPELSTAHLLPEGTVIASFEEAWENLPPHALEKLGTIATLNGKLGSTNDERFVHLNSAFLGEGIVIYLPKNAVVEELIQALFITKADHGAFAAHPRLLVVLEEGAEVKVLEAYLGLEGKAFNNAVVEVSLGERAILEHIRLQEETLDSIHVGATYVYQESKSVYTSNTVSFGAATSRHDINAFVDGEHVETWLNGAYVGLGDQVADHHTRIDHAKPNCNSFEVYKGILDGHAIGVFNGKIFVYEDAQKTDAKQTNQAILLSATATINTKPQLEIFADDVKCTHGATVGQLSEEALFYLRARGIPYDEARSLLVYAFAAEVLHKITHNGLREAFEARLYQKLER